MPKIEDRKLTAKENYLKLLNGEMPEWVPIYTMGMPLPGEPMPLAMVGPSVLKDPHVTGGGKDIWGVNWVGSYETGGAILPEPNNFLLEDICDWHDVVKAPDISDIDWEMVCKKDLEIFNIDRESTGMGMNLYVGTFQQLVALMGFTEGLIAMIEEPEETYQLCKYINDFYIEVGKHCMPYFKPDVLVMMDDTCSANAPFMSEELFRQILLPCYQDMTNQISAAADIPAQFHNCGVAANFIEICHTEAGIVAWDPAQTMNDLEGFKKKWGREIAILGGYDATDELLDPDCSDELIVQSVHDTYDKLAPDGGYAFCGGFIGPLDDPRIMHKNDVLFKACCEYGNTFYD